MRLLWATLSLLILTSTGCSSFTGKPLWSPFKSKAAKDDDTVLKDEWGWVGEQGRGDRPMEYENDPLKKLLFDKRSLDIERNLGIGE